MSKAVLLNDGLSNVVTGFGTSADSRSGRVHVRQFFNPQQIEAAYASSWIVRRCIDLPSQEMFRKWRIWDGDPVHVGRITHYERLLNIREQVERAHRLSRVWGGSLLVLIKGSEPLEGPLTAMGSDGLAAVHVAGRRDLRTGSVDTNIASHAFGSAEYYEFQGGGRAQRIDPSRVVRFDGPEDPAQMRQTDDWGLSVVSLIGDAIDDFLSAKGNMAALTDEAKLDVMAIEGLSQLFAQSGGEEQLKKRLETVMLSKSIHNALIMDASEKFEQKHINFAGLPDVVQKLMMHVAAAAGIPMSKLFGQSASGLNTTGEGDERNFEARLEAEQENIIRPRLEQLDKWLLATANVPAGEVSWRWAPMRKMTEAQESEIAERNAKALAVMANATTIDQSIIDGIGLNMLRASPVFDGADAVIDDFDESTDDPIDDIT